MKDLEYPTDITTAVRANDMSAEGKIFRPSVVAFEQEKAGAQAPVILPYEAMSGTDNHKALALGQQLIAAYLFHGGDHRDTSYAAAELRTAIEAQFRYRGWMGADLASAYLDFHLAAVAMGLWTANRMASEEGRKLRLALLEWQAQTVWFLQLTVDYEQMISAQLRATNDGVVTNALASYLCTGRALPPDLARRWRNTEHGTKDTRWMWVGCRWMSWMLSHGELDDLADRPRLQMSIRYPMEISSGRATGSRFFDDGNYGLPPANTDPCLEKGRIEAPLVRLTRRPNQNVNQLYDALV